MLAATRVTVRTADSAMHSRTYVPGSEVTMSQQEFAEWALGNLIALVTSGYVDTLDLGPSWTGTSYGDVALTTTAGHVLPQELTVPDLSQIVTGWAVELMGE